MRRLFVLSMMLVLVAAARGEDAKDAADHRNEGIKALRESQTTPRLVVTAAKHFAKAAAIYEKVGEKDAAVEANSFLYWCKKKMTLADIEDFTKAGEVALSAQLKALDDVKVEAADAQTWFDRAEKFAAAQPDEHLLIAIRFFEVGDRFKDTDVGRAAIDRSLKEMQLIAAAPTTKPEPAPIRPVAEAIAKERVPDAAKLKNAEKSIKDLFKDEYAKRSVEDKQALGQKLLRQAMESKDDPATRYVMLKESATNAAAGSDAETAMKALDALEQSFEADASTLKAETLAKITPLTADAAKALARIYLRAIHGAISADSYDAAARLCTGAEAAARKAQDVNLLTQITTRSKDVRTIQSEFLGVKSSQNTLKEKADDPEANLIVGKFTCFSKGDWKKGLVFLTKGKDERLAALARAEIQSDGKADSLGNVADDWWEYSEKQPNSIKRTIQLHAADQYERALGAMTGFQQARAFKRVATLRPVNLIHYLDATDFRDLQLTNDGIEVSGGESQRLRTKEKFKPPFTIEAVIKTSNTNVRLYANSGVVIFNWEVRQTEFRFMDPLNNQVAALPEKGAIPRNTFVKIVWRFDPDKTSVSIDDKEVFSKKQDYSKLEAEVGVGTHGSRITLKSLSVTTTPAGR